MIYLHKILPLFLSPIFIVLALLAVGAVTRRRAWVIGGICLLYLVSMPIIADGLTSAGEGNYERVLPADAPSSEAIVVLGRGMSWVKVKNSYVPDWGDPDRFFGGVELMLANKGRQLVFTGGKLPWQRTDETEGDVLKRYAQMMQVPSGNILLTEPVENTEQEARAVRKLLGAEAKKIILVTSAFHMRRAQGLFEQAGFEVFAYPVDFQGESAEDITVLSFLPNPYALASVHSTVREFWGRLYYQFRHSIFSVSRDE